MRFPRQLALLLVAVAASGCVRFVTEAEARANGQTLSRTVARDYQAVYIDLTRKMENCYTEHDWLTPVLDVDGDVFGDLGKANIYGQMGSGGAFGYRILVDLTALPEHGTEVSVTTYKEWLPAMESILSWAAGNLSAECWPNS